MRPYSVQMLGVSVSAAKDLFRVSAPSTMQLVLLRAWLSQEVSEVSEQSAVILQRASTDGTGTAETPEKGRVGDAAATFTAVSNLTADTTLTTDPFIREGFNWLTGWLYIPAAEERIWVPPSGRLVLRLPTAPTAALTVSAGMVLLEVG